MEVFQESGDISCLFPEILTIIFQHLDVCDRGRAAQVCTKWRDAAYNRRVWKKVEAKLHLRRSTVALFPSLVKRGIVSIRVLSLRRGLREVVSDIRGLESLNLCGCYNVTDACLASAITSPLFSLTTLNLSLCKALTDSSIERIAKLVPNLIHLDLGGCSFITANGLMFIAWGLSKLKHLNLRGCKLISDRGIGNICGHNVNVTGAKGNLGLENLVLQDCQKLSDQTLKHISTGLNKLKLLNLSFCCRITDTGIRYLAKMSSLKHLQLRMCQNISDIGMGYLSEGGSRLTHLDLSFCERITDDTLVHISQGLFQLHSLSVCSCTISDEGIAKMVRTSHDLEILNIGQCSQITDNAMEFIAEYLKQLKVIDLYGCSKVTKDGLEKIMQLPHMQDLNLKLWHQAFL